MLDNDPLWYKDAIIYELHVRAFHDAVGDGTGEFRGLTQKLDYLQDLGVTAVWLLPFYPSPLKDDGYDIADYTSIHPDYGSLRDFKAFLKAAHERGLRVINELVINHTSDQHPWFQRARRSPPGSSYRDFYVWSDTPDKYREARIIFKDFESSNWTWDPVAHAYYWHRFYGHQPDLNYDNPEVWQAIFPLVDFWLGLGVDGMRLDAVPYLFEREGTTCENLPETHDFLRAVRRHVDERFTNRMLLAEANQWPEDAIAYFGQGDECQMAFHFPVMPRLFMAIHMEDRFAVMDIMAQTPAIPDTCQWCLFLRNHDELTLEMVTDEERDYMYQAYASDPRARINLGIRRRLAPLLGNNLRRIELMNALLFSLPGTPVIYYGEEIGMGENIYLGDRNSVRTPMQWSSDRNAGFSRANPQKLYLPVIIDPEYHYEALNVEAQQNNPNSLLWWMKRLISLRKRYRAFGRGSLEFLHPENRKILAFLRRWSPHSRSASGDGRAEQSGPPVSVERGGEAEECVLVVANLSRFVQYVELDLSAFQGQVPVELFGGNPFPPIGKAPYLLTLSPHSFYWFALVPQAAPERGAVLEAQMAEVRAAGSWEEVFANVAHSGLVEALPCYLAGRPWFGGKGRTVKSTAIRQAVRVAYGDRAAFVTLVHVEFSDGAPEVYLLPLAFATGDEASRLLLESPQAVVAWVAGGSEGVLFDALHDPGFCTMIVEAIRAGRLQDETDRGPLTATACPLLEQLLPAGETVPSPSLSKTEQANTSIIYGGRLIAKVFRRVEEGVNPELDVGRYLTEKKGFDHVAPTLGTIELRRRRAEPATLLVLHGFVPNEGDAWQFTLDALSIFFERVLTGQAGEPALPSDEGGAVPPAVREMIGPYLDSAALLGRRTAELHLALASETDDAAFVPEPFARYYQRSLYQSMRNLIARVFQQMRQGFGRVPEADREQVRQVLDLEKEILQRFGFFVESRFTGLRIRCHGDYHLGQVLFTGKDFVLLDFEGEPARTINDRRVKRSALQDVAGMLRSFHRAAYATLFGQATGRGRPPGLIRPEDAAASALWARFWYAWVSAAFLQSYREAATPGQFLPAAPEEFQRLLHAWMLEKAITELGQEIDRPDWIRIPVQGFLQLMQAGG